MESAFIESLLQHPARGALLVLDASATVVRRNAAADRFYSSAIAAEIAPALRAAIEGLLGGAPSATEFRHLRDAGALNVTLRIVRAPSQELLGYTVSVHPDDPAEPQDGDHDAERWRFALENAEDGLWDWSADGNRVFRSARVLRMLGYADDALPDTIEAWQSLVHPDDRAAQGVAIAAHLVGDQRSYQVEYRVRDADGRWRWILDRGKVMAWTADGKPQRVIGTHADITAYKQLESRLRERERLLNQAQRLASIGSWLCKFETGEVRWSDEMFRITGWPRQQPPPPHDQQQALWTPDSYARLEQALALAREEGKAFQLELDLIRADDHELRNVVARGEAVRDDTGRVVRLTGVLQDVTDARMALEASRRERQLLDRVSAMGNIGGYELHPESGKVFLTDQCCRLLGIEPRGPMTTLEVIGLYAPESQSVVREAVRVAVTTGGTFDLELDLVKANGGRFSIRTQGEAEMLHGRCVRLFGTAQDITERKAEQQRIAHLAHYDTLTGLPNRVLFGDRAQVAIARARRNRIPLALLYIDLDNFKIVNDSLGHAAGDLLLQEVARRFVACVRAADTVCRQGGDEFLVLLPEIRHPEDAAVIAQKLVTALDPPVELPGMDAPVGCSIGIALLSDQSTDLATLLRNADAAMYEAKSTGRRRYRFFSDDLQQRAHKRLALENDLREALAQQRFLLHYQPQIDLESGRIVGLEALLRLQFDGQPARNAGEFITTAEDSGLIVPLGEWVLGSACRQLRAWHEQGFGQLRVALNMSPVQLRQDRFAEHLQQVCAQHSLPTSAIEIELRESVLMDDPIFAQGLLERLAAVGVSVAVDDFGTGFSNLAQLRRFRLSRLKIDRGFVATLESNPEHMMVADAIVSLGHTLGMRVIAEGVESAIALSRLRTLGCDEAQGYFLSVPLAADEVAPWLAQHEAGASHADPA
jgi:diguanylate cyclase (GGDEF)-like protein/PAS domain S-box-containing protein